ncbi:MAG: sugar phosphate isomerase/epimerase family protein [Anaerolineae bacterium]
MKISFMTFACPDYGFDQVIGLGARHGYDGIEFRIDSDHRHGVMVQAPKEARAAYRRRLQDAGLEPCCLATSLQFANEDAVGNTPARLELAADLGCPGLRVFCGPLPAGTAVADAIPRVAERLRQVSDSAQQAGVKLWLETHDSISLGADAGAVVRQVNHPFVRINWDNMHPFRNGEPLAVTWGAIGHYIEHTHFHDSVAKPGAPIITPFFQGGLPVQAMYDLLRDANYAGYYSGEWFGDQMGSDADASLAAHKEGLLALEADWQARHA